MATMLSARTHEPLGGSGGGGGSGAGNGNKHSASRSLSINNHTQINYLNTDDQDAEDQRAIDKLLNADVVDGLQFTTGGTFTVNDGTEEEKADNAVDYEDIDEIAEDDNLDKAFGAGAMEVSVKVEEEGLRVEDEMGGLFGEGEFGAGDEVDGLFDEGFEMGQIEGGHGMEIPLNMSVDMGISKPPHFCGTDFVVSQSFGSDITLEDSYDSLGLGELHDKPRALTKEEELALYWPDFKPHTILNFNKLIPIKEAKYPTALVKQPKVLLPTKVTLEPAPDDQRSFLRPGPGKGRKNNENGLIYTHNVVEMDGEMNLVRENEKDHFDESVLRAIEMCCDDWEAKIFPPNSPEMRPAGKSALGTEEEGLEYELDIRPAKVCSRDISVSLDPENTNQHTSDRNFCIVIWRTCLQIGWMWRIYVKAGWSY